LLESSGALLGLFGLELARLDECLLGARVGCAPACLCFRGLVASHHNGFSGDEPYPAVITKGELTDIMRRLDSLERQLKTLKEKSR